MRGIGMGRRKIRRMMRWTRSYVLGSAVGNGKGWTGRDGKWLRMMTLRA